MSDTDKDFDLDEYERKYSGGEITGPLLAEIKRLQKYERFLQHMDDIYHTHGSLKECWETEVLKVIGEEE